MKETEYEILDQLYFVTSYEELVALMDRDDEELNSTLWEMIKKGWVKCLDGPENEIKITKNAFLKNYQKYQYLASKQGLMEHNLR